MVTFESVWRYLEENLKPGMKVNNWTAFHGYLGDSMTIEAVSSRAIEVNAPKAKTIQIVPREDFQTIWEIWIEYKQDKIQRQEIREMTRFSKYIISILNWYEEEVRNPGHADQEFRGMSISDSDSCRSVLPAMPIRQPGKKRGKMAG